MSHSPAINRLARAKELDSLIDKSVPAWAEIQKSGLWSELGFTSFTAYVESKGESYQAIWRAIQFEKVQASLPEVEIPNAATARAINQVPKFQRRAVVNAALEATDGNLTVPAIKNAVASLPATKKRVLTVPKDGTGLPILPEISQFWSRNEEIKAQLAVLKSIRLTIQKANENGDKLYCKMDRQGTISRLKSIEEELQSAMSFAVCHKCNGVLFQDCEECKGRGTMSEFWWRMVDINIRELRPIVILNRGEK